MKRATLSSPLKLSPCCWAKQAPWSHVRCRAFLSKAGIPGAIAESHCLLFPVCTQLMGFYWTKWCNYANSWCVIPWSPAPARLSDFAWSTLFLQQLFQTVSCHRNPLSLLRWENGSFPDENHLTLRSQGYKPNSVWIHPPILPVFYNEEKRKKASPV